MFHFFEAVLSRIARRRPFSVYSSASIPTFSPYFSIVLVVTGPIEASIFLLNISFISLLSLK